MVFVALSSFFLNPGGLIFLSLLIPLFLLYLIKPKPMRRTIPSLMFILKDTGRNKINRLFRNWLADLLLLFHFIIVLALALSLAQPYINVPQSLFVQDTILVIDVSASMRVDDRFDDAIDLAIDSLAERNTIILAQGFPELIAEGVPATRARSILRDLEVKDTTTNLADSIQLANQYSGPNTNVVIISDFLPSAGNLELTAQLDALQSKGAIVTKHVLGEPVPNVGIVDLAVRDDTSKVWVKNFDSRPTEATLRIGDAEQTILLAKSETKELSFATPQGVTEITILEEDALVSDNTVWISTPADNAIDILVFTNNQQGYESSRLKLAFDIIDRNFPIHINTQFAVWPKVPTLNHDVYLFYESNPQLIIPGYIDDVRERVEDGAAVIITAQNGLFGIDFKGMLPVSYVDSGAAAEVVAATDNLLTNDITFGQVQSYSRVEAAQGVTVVAQAGDDPLITMSKLGRGTVMYYGYQEGAESFSSENSYPVFWRRVLDIATNRPTLRSLNVETGTLLTFPKEERLRTPDGRVTTQLLRVERAGLYILEDRTITANLLSDLESNTNREPAFKEEANTGAEESEKKLPKDLANILLLIGLGVLYLELIYIKLRGDL